MQRFLFIKMGEGIQMSLIPDLLKVKFYCRDTGNPTVQKVCMILLYGIEREQSLSSKTKLEVIVG
jgi:hypothetical protein